MTKNKTRKMIRTRKNDQFYGLIALNIIGKRNDEQNEERLMMKEGVLMGIHNEILESAIL